MAHESAFTHEGTFFLGAQKPEVVKYLFPEFYEQSLLKSKKHGTDLVALDPIVWHVLGVKFLNGDAKVADLAVLMKYKLKRGQFRPNLLQLIESNSQEALDNALACLKDAVESIRKEYESFDVDCDGTFMNYVPSFNKYLKQLAELRGCGPATASLILSTCSEHVPFFADEAYLAVRKTGLIKPIAYTFPAYFAFVKEIWKRSREIGVSPRDFSNALWSYTTYHK